MEKLFDNKQNKSFLSHFLAIGSGTVISMLLGLLTTPIITRIVDPNEYGQLSIFQMYTGIALMVLCLGLDQALVRFYYDKDDLSYKQALLRHCFWIPLLVSCIVACAASILALMRVVTFEFEPCIIVLLGVNVIVSVANHIALLVLRINYQSKLYSTSMVLTKLTFIIISFCLILTIQSHYFLLLCIATICSVLVPTVFAIFASRRLWRIHVDYQLSNRSEIMKYGLPLILSMGITTVFQAIDKMSLNHYCTYADVGIYSSAMTLVHVFAIIQSTFNSLWGPMQVEHYVKHPEDTGYIQKANQMITVIMFFLGISLILVKDVFALLLGEKYRMAGVILPFLIFNPIMYTISETTCAGIGISKKSYLNIVVAGGACITNFLGNTLLVPLFGCQGAAISTGISYIVFFALRTFLSNRYYYVDYKIPKLIVLTIFVSGYALYNTFIPFNLLSVVFYVFLVVLLFVLYYSAIKNVLVLIKNILKKQRQS